jgi:hypothetical protein
MTWTRRTWTHWLCASDCLGLGDGGQVTTDQPAGGHQLDQAAPAGRVDLRSTPRHPSTPGTPARGRACLSAPARGSRETHPKKRVRRKFGLRHPGGGGRR